MMHIESDRLLETAMVEGQVLLVEPQGKTIVAVIAHEL